MPRARSASAEGRMGGDTATSTDQLATPLDGDYFASGGLADEFGRVDVKIANRSLLHVLHCSTSNATQLKHAHMCAGLSPKQRS